MSSITDSQSISERLDYWGSSPIPASLVGNFLLLKGALIKAPVAEGGSSGLLKLKSAAAAAKPTRVSCYGFATANLLGAWIIYDGDPVVGAGFTFAWSILYLIVNGGASVKSLFRGRISPIGLSLLTLGNTAIYGNKFLWSKESPLQ
ncbi:Altered inheritance of mitochondria protein 19 mitochondrial [Spathaspora sp. JA1]|nr:Altered inheritance of mitochondria protein 19 mitochondrial [Spathaspora sp. JA1]